LFAAMGVPGLPDKQTMIDLRVELAANESMKYYPVLAMVEPLLAIFTGDLAGAEAAAERARVHADPWARATAQLGRAFLAENEGQAEEAEREAVGALDAYRKLGDRWGQAMALGQLSERRTLRADHAGAVAAYEESVRLVNQLGTLDDLPELYARMAGQRARAGDLEGAERDIRLGLKGARDRANVESESLLLSELANLFRRRGDLAAAGEHLELAVSAVAEISRPQGHWRALSESIRAKIAVARDEPEVARAALRDGVAAMKDLPDLPVIAMLAEGAAAMVMCNGDARTAAGLLGLATGLRGTPDLGNVELDELVARIQAVIGAEAYESAYRHGAGLEREAALAELDAVLGESE
jgi:tetratricopeptide (TPR) repeat protein